MSELVAPRMEGRFHQLLEQELGGQEFEGKNIPVIAVGGLPGAGVTSTCQELARIIHEETGRNVFLSSFEDERNRIYHERTGVRRVDLFSEPELQASIDTDFYWVRQMVNPQNRGSVLIMDGRLAPFIAREAEFAEKELLQQGRIAHPAPFDVLTAYLFAKEDIRHTRKYLEATRQDPNLNFDQYREELKRQVVEETRAFISTWPDLMGMTPNNMNFQVHGRQVYDMREQTDGYTAEEVARRMWDSGRIQVFLNRTGIAA